jgi:hypothetical protein
VALWLFANVEKKSDQWTITGQTELKLEKFWVAGFLMVAP